MRDGLFRRALDGSPSGDLEALNKFFKDAERAMPWRLHMRDGFLRRNHDPPLRLNDSRGTDPCVHHDAPRGPANMQSIGLAALDGSPSGDLEALKTF
ncbi:hypothetical protein N9L19_01220, partial [bacterium]|nr:hypothetical protein [bacterium]